ncbi:MAG TPA: glycosyltransferase [Bacteroidia bacterium]|nr:glycosyltransferase [Bacteroidia bacterium]
MKLLMLLSRFPYPLEKGDKLRAFQHIQMLSSKYELHLIALSDTAVNDKQLEALRPYCASIKVIRLNPVTLIFNLIAAFIKRLPLQVGYFHNKSIEKEIIKVAARLKPEVVFCQLIRTALYGKVVDAQVKIIDYQDAFSAGTKQRLNDAPALMKPLFRRELKLVRQFEEESFRWFRKHLVISDSDRKQLAITDSKSIVILPNGVRIQEQLSDSADKSIDVLFVGNMQYRPNVDAATFLVKEIMPFVWKKLPEASVTLCGADPSSEVRKLESSLVQVTGWVENVEVYYKKAKVFVAPMRIGTGLQNKLLEAFAAGLPVITTPLSATPLSGLQDEDYLVSNSAGSFAENIVRLLTDSALRTRVGTNGNRLVRQKFSMQAVQEELLAFMEAK